MELDCIGSQGPQGSEEEEEEEEEVTLSGR
jgi:hypothetical protein